MRKFLVKLSFFLCPLFILMYPSDRLLSGLLKKTNGYHGEIEVQTDIYSGEASCDIAVYGSSRSWVHINPKILADSLALNVYNFGIDGHNFWLQYLRNLEIFKSKLSPKKIILSLDVFTLQKRPDLYNGEQFLPFMLWNKNIRQFTRSYEGFHPLDYYVPLIRFAGKYKAVAEAIKCFFRSGPKLRTRGFRGDNSTWTSDFEKAKAKAKAYNIITDQNTIALFEKFINECKIKKIDLLFVYTPEYKEGQAFVANRKAVFDIFENMASKYKIPFLDYSNDSISLQKPLFYNVSHLNSNGADIFTRKLAHDLININFTK